MKNDMKEIFFNEEQLAEKVKELGEKITADYKEITDDKGILLVGVLKGAAVFFTDLARKIDLPVRFDFMMASSYGDASVSSGKVEIKKDLDVDVRNYHVLLVEDIIDSGITMECLMRILNQRGAASVKLCALFSKPARRKIPVNIDYLGFEIPDEFIVGYGLDYAEKYRNLPYVGVLKSEIYTD